MSKSFYGTFPVKEIDSAIDLDAVIIGVPFEDNSKIYSKGASSAPKSIRKASSFFSGQSLSEQSIHQQNVLDLMNLDENLNYEEMQDKLSDSVQKILQKEALPIILGGDHSIALGTAKGIINSKTEIDSIVWLDAHLDLMNEYPEGEKFTRATVLRRILEIDFIEPKDVYFIGSRGHNLGLEEIECFKDQGMNVIEAKTFQNRNILLGSLSKIATEKKNIYVSLDIDVLDPAYAPGVSVPEPGGLSTRELFEIVNLFAKNTRCFELVEVNPQLDINEITSKVASKVIFELLDSR
ncbi:MAG: arginase family protein [Candidatus Heimdallarchaeota archaeon]|nr:arginase family protein [Candidatus Heimdallarchaeota archaeon]MBY8993258.1 arginase family protein [Candidatus Heimdallarchaeota archaeon]